LTNFKKYIEKHCFDKQLLKDFKDQWMKGNRANEYGEWL